MALKSGRVGVRNDQVDTYGRIVSEGLSNMETRVNEEGKPQWREKGTEEWQNFSGGGAIPTIDFGGNSGKTLYIAIAQEEATPPKAIIVYSDSDRETEVGRAYNEEGLEMIKILNAPEYSSTTGIFSRLYADEFITYLPKTQLGSSVLNSDSQDRGLYFKNSRTTSNVGVAMIFV